MAFSKSYLLIVVILQLCQQVISSGPNKFLIACFRNLLLQSNDSTKAITLLEIGESIEVSRPQKSMEYYRQALHTGQRIKNNRVILSSYHDIGVCYINLNKMDSAIIAFENAIPYARLLNDTGRVARVLG